MRRLTAATIVILAVLAAGPSAWAARDAAIAAFYGNWGGSAIAKNRDSIYFGVTLRDLDVNVAPADGGFRISWTTVFRRGGTPENPRIRRKTTELRFVSTGPGLYEAVGARRPGIGGTYSWARLKDNTLLIQIFAIDNEGVYQLSRYERTLSGSGMDLEFSVIRDGTELRTVTGRLVKHR